MRLLIMGPQGVGKGTQAALLSEHYTAMKRYIQYIIDQTIETETNLIVQTRSWGDLCDWLGLEAEKKD